MPTSERPKSMHVQRTIACLAAIFVWATLDSGGAFGQSPELREAFTTYSTFYEQGRYSDAEPYAEEALRLAREELGPNELLAGTVFGKVAELYSAQAINIFLYYDFRFFVGFMWDLITATEGVAGFFPRKSFYLYPTTLKLIFL